MYTDLFKRITRASQNKSLTFFVGAGVSKLSNAPKWSELIDAFCDTMGKPKKNPYSSEDYLSIPQMYYYSINQDFNKYFSFVEGCFSKEELKPNLIHKMLFDFNPNAFITTNFDDLIEQAAIDNCQSFKSIACDSEIPRINGDRFVLKIHGDLKHKNIVLKEEDYLNYSETFKLTETLLKSIFASNTVVFIGYSLNDYNIKLILNWTKSLLKEDFSAPIFIYTDWLQLTDEELKYHESKGVRLVDFRNCGGKNLKEKDFLGRYKCVLDSIKRSAEFSTSGKNEVEALDVLYNLLLPLDKMSTLRPRDFRQVLPKEIIIEESGAINTSSGTSILLKYFIEISKMDEEKRKQLSFEVATKYDKICKIFDKARINWIHDSKGSYEFIKSSSCFADEKCISYDYVAMMDYINQEYIDSYENYKKAYYLARLKKYKKAYDLFGKISIDAYKSGDYLLYYRCVSNRYCLHLGMRHFDLYYDIFHSNDEDMKTKNVEAIFDKMPIEFKNQYQCFKNLTSFDLLYENSYYSFIEGQKLQDAIESNTSEWGLTSYQKVICRINHNLHFFLGNGLCMEEFSEFKNTIRNLMSLVVCKFSDQGKKVLRDTDIFDNREKVYFDQIDFYCFIEYFDSKQIKKLIQKYDIKSIDFENIEEIEKTISNLITYYELVIKNKDNNIEINSIEIKIKNCLALLRYMNVSQKLVDSICSFIFKYEFRDITIDEKILFLDAQLYCKKKYSETTSKVIENTLMNYIDQEIKAVSEKKDFRVFSKIANINYDNLVDYISDNANYTSKRLSHRVSKIIKSPHFRFKEAVMYQYYRYVSEYQKRKIEIWIKNELNNEFNIDEMRFLVWNRVKIDGAIINSLKKHLDEAINQSKQKPKIKVKTYPIHEPLECLNDVGYWCLSGLLDKKSFKKYVGQSDVFDFFYQYEKFDFRKFDISWLFKWQSHVIETIAKSEKIKGTIRKLIADQINANELNSQEQKKLLHMMAKYFC